VILHLTVQFLPHEQLC